LAKTQSNNCQTVLKPPKFKITLPKKKAVHNAKLNGKISWIAFLRYFAKNETSFILSD
jgi:hypothetical protein